MRSRVNITSSSEQSTSSSSEILTNIPAGWIVNSRTHVIHHEKACRDHLPRENNRNPPDERDTTAHIHKGYEQRIYDVLSSETLANAEIETAIDLLNKGINLSPLSFHFYDRLIGAYGRLRRYEEIIDMLEAALQNVETQIAGVDTGGVSRDPRRLQRARKEFKNRLDCAKSKRQKNKCN